MGREISISEGTKAINHSANAKKSNSSSDFSQPVIYGRVVAIALTINDQLYKDTNCLEAIKFEPFRDTTILQESGDVTQQYLVAFKKHASVRTPVLNEIVPVQPAPDLNAQVKSQQYSSVFYYDDPISVFNSTEHNATPDENTLNNLTPGSKINNLTNYQASSTGIQPQTNKSSTITKKDNIKLGSYFTEQGIKPLSPIEGDFKLEGRFGNSIRFSGTPSSDITQDLVWSGPVGNPITIIRNGQQNIDPGANIASLHEDINSDGSSVYLLSSQAIELVLGSDNFDSYNQKITNTPASNIIMQGGSPANNSQSLNEQQGSIPTTLPIFPLATGSGQLPPVNQDLDNVPDNESDFNFVQIGEDVEVPLTQGVVLNNYSSKYQFILGVSSNSIPATNLNKASAQSSSKINVINKFAGVVNNVPTISKQGRALIDLVALTEGTMGAGNFNGYDILVGGSLIPGFTGINSAPQHPNIAIYIPRIDNKSTAAGRYQFLNSTWITFAGSGTTMSRFNQDYACWKLILNGANVPSVMIGAMDTDMNIFTKVINMMAPQWASLPVINDPKGLYGQAGRFTFASLQSYYSAILQKYS